MDSNPWAPLPDLPPTSRALTMAALVQLEPQSLRRLLKAGLRQGATVEQLAALFVEGWGLDVHSDEVQAFLAELENRGWLQQEGLRWKTRLGKSQGC